MSLLHFFMSMGRSTAFVSEQGVGKLWPRGQIQPISYFCMAQKLKILFFFFTCLNGCKPTTMTRTMQNMWENWKWLEKPKIFPIFPLTEKFVSVPVYLFQDICIVNSLGNYIVSPLWSKKKACLLKD